MDRKALLALIPDESRAKATEALDAILDEAREAGRNAAGYDRRQTDKAVKELTTERDQLKAQVTELEGKATGVSEATGKLKEYERQIKALEGERDKMLPIVKQHRDNALRTAVMEAANLRDDLYADALISRMAIALGDDDKLTKDALTALETWSKDPANKDRVKAQSAHPSAPPLSQTGPVSDPVKAWMARLPAHEREALTK